MNGLDGLGVGSSDLDFGAARSISVHVVNLVAQLGHHRRARGCGVVDEHRYVEISGRETLNDVRKVHANLVPGSLIFGVVGGDIDDAAGLVQAEMMGRCLVRETHRVVAPSGHPLVMGSTCGRGRWLLRGGQLRSEQGNPERSGNVLGMSSHGGLDGGCTKGCAAGSKLQHFSVRLSK